MTPLASWVLIGLLIVMAGCATHVVIEISRWVDRRQDAYLARDDR